MRALLLAGIAVLTLAPATGWAQSRGPFGQNAKLYSNTSGAPPGYVGLNDFLATKLDTAAIGTTVAELISGLVPVGELPAALSGTPGAMSLYTAGVQGLNAAWAASGFNFTSAPTPVQVNTALNGTAKVVNAVLAGADPTGVADSAPALRGAIASNETLLIPPGTYRLASTVTPPCCAYDNPAVYVHGLSNFAITANGATFVVDPSIALSSAWLFDSDKNFSVSGINVQGSRSGLTSGQENVAFAFTSDFNFRASDLHIAPGFGGNGAALAGDWLVNGLFQNITMDGVGHCEDMAFLKGVTFLMQRAIGADTNGNEGTGQLGQTCFSVINDVPNAATNNSGVSFTETDGVNVLDTNESNFVTGFAISSGLHYHLAGNDWHDNPGLSSSPGLGGYIFYTNGGVASSVGVPPGDITISDTFANNGSVVPGYGLAISAGAIANSDTISGLSVGGSTFDNNAAIGVGSDVSTGLSDIAISGDNNFTGAAQTTAINSNLTAVLPGYQVPGNPQVFATVRLTGGTSGVGAYLANNVAIEYASSAGGYAPTMGVSGTNVLYLRPASSAAYIQLQDYAGTNLLQLGDAGIVGNNIPVSFANTLTVTGVITGSSGFKAGSTAGATCTGTPTSSFATVGGIVTHC